MTKNKKCIPVDDIIKWTVAGYVAYSIVLYVFRKPACGYVQKICNKVNVNPS